MEIDNVTLILLFILLALLLYSRYSGPSPLVHPLLLGKQSEVSNVRKAGETGIYRSFATGQGTPLTVRPANTLKTVHDVALKKEGAETNKPRCILDTSLTDEALKEILRLIPLGLRAIFPSLSSDTNDPGDVEEKPILVLLPPSPTTALPSLLLALCAPPSNPLIILPSPLLFTSALQSKAHPAPAVVVVWRDLVDEVIEDIFENCGAVVGVLVVGDTDRIKDEVASGAASKGMTVGWWEEVFEKGEQSNDVVNEATFGDVHSYFYNCPPGEPIVAKVHHLNVTAGIAGLLSLFPADKRPSSKDVIASSVRLDTPLGMSIAMASIWSGAGFRMIGDPNPVWDLGDGIDHAGQLMELSKSGWPTPSILFMTSRHHETLLSLLYTSYKAHPLGGFAASQRVASLAEGHVSREGLWEKYVWSGIRSKAVSGLAGDKLRAMVIVGDAPFESSLGLSHVLLGLPHSRIHPSHLSAGPVFVTHFHDIQISTPWESILGSPKGEGLRAHVGPPASNVEVILKGPGVEAIGADEKGGKADGWTEDPLKGRVWIRGPAVLERVDGGGEVIEGWVDTGEEASVKTNGTFVISPRA